MSHVSSFEKATRFSAIPETEKGVSDETAAEVVELEVAEVVAPLIVETAVVPEPAGKDDAAEITDGVAIELTAGTE